MRNPTFDAHLEKMRAVHNAKNHDYSADGDPLSNFKFAATVAGCSVDTVFRVLLGVKLARLDELLKGKTPNHESLDDSILDLSIYAALWASYRADPGGPLQDRSIHVPERTFHADGFLE
jgi:hypothetical protein